MERAETDERNICIENESDRQRQTDRDRQTDRQRQTDRDRCTETGQRKRQTDIDIEGETQRDVTDKDRDTRTDRQTDRVTGTERDTCIDTRIIDTWTGGWMNRNTHRDRQTVSQSRDNGFAGQTETARSIHT